MVSSNLMNKTFNMVGCGRWHIMNFCLSLVFNMIYSTENMKLKNGKKGYLVVSITYSTIKLRRESYGVLYLMLTNFIYC